jgi:hypothetical protein
MGSWDGMKIKSVEFRLKNINKRNIKIIASLLQESGFLKDLLVGSLRCGYVPIHRFSADHFPI